MLGAGQFELFWDMEWDVPWDTFGLSEEFKDLVWKMLQPNPQNRITLEEALEHPWIKDNKLDFESELVAFYSRRFQQYAKGKADEERAKDGDLTHYWEKLMKLQK